MKRSRKQLSLFAAAHQSATWLRLPEERRKEIIDRIARLIARAAKVRPSST